MTEAQIQRYARHVLLPDVGGVGQRRLLAARVAIDLGDGDVAAAYAAAFAAAAGVGRLDLGGQLGAPVTAEEVRDGPLLAADDVGAARGAAFARAIAALNPDIQVGLGDVPETERADPERDGAVVAIPIVIAPRPRSAIDALIDGAAAAAAVIAAIARGTP